MFACFSVLYREGASGREKKRKSFYASVEKKELMRGRGWVFKMRVNLNHLLRIVGFEICTNESGELPENICPLVFGEKKNVWKPFHVSE